jgi:hypothetical protein
MPVTTIPTRPKVTPRDEATFEFSEILRQSTEVWSNLGLLLDVMLYRRGYL